MSCATELKHFENTYQNLIMGMAEGFALHRVIPDETGSPADYLFVEINPAFENITGLKSENILGKTVREIFPRTAGHLVENFRKVSLSGKPHVFERHNFETGRHLQISAYCSAEGLLACIVVDISERIRIETALLEREKQYRELAERANAVMLRWRPSGTITYINEFGENCFGFRKEELVGKNVLGTIVEPNDTSGRDLAAMIREIAVSPDSFNNNENENITRDGRRLWIMWNNSAIFDDENNIIEIVSVGRDYTEQKRISDALKESEATFRTHIENSFDVIFTLDAEGTFLFISPSWGRHFGYPPSEVIGKSFAPFVHPDDVQPCIEYLTRVLSTGQSGTSPRYRVKRIDGTWLSFVANGARYIDIKGQLLFIGVGHDITEQLQAEEERLSLERQLFHSQKLESLGVLAGGIAHDFNNLLQAILGNLELANLRLAPDSTPYKCISHAKHAARHAADLTSRMLAYSGKGHFVIERMALNDLVNENAAMLRTAVPRSISIDLHTDRPIPAILADSAQIQQVVMNLISNAAEAIENQPGKIKLTTGQQIYDRTGLAGSCLPDKPEPGRFVFLEITDNGVGMNDETRARIFDPFFTTKFTGRGLGMSAVQGIIKGHGGALFMESAPGKGTTIRVAFPVVDSEAAASAQKADTGAAEKTALAASPLSGVALVVDDEKSVRRIAVTMVGLCGLRVITANDGIDAVRKYREHLEEIDVVLLDLTMPNMDGISAMMELRLIKPDVKIILSSGFNEQELDERVIGQAPSGFIRKPYSMDELETELRRVMAGTEG